MSLPTSNTWRLYTTRLFSLDEINLVERDSFCGEAGGLPAPTTLASVSRWFPTSRLLRSHAGGLGGVQSTPTPRLEKAICRYRIVLV